MAVLPRILILFPLFLLTVPEAHASSRVFGTIRYRGIIPAAKHRPVTVDTSTCGPEAVTDEVVLGAYGELPNTVVSLRGAMTSTPQPIPSTEVVIDQKNCRFSPAVVIVRTGQDLVVKNSDGLAHALRTVSRTNPIFKRNQSGDKGEEARFRFASPEVVELRCDVHDWMRALIVVTDHPFMGISDAKGRFSITNVPAGNYWIEARHFLLGGKNKRIQVRESEEVKIDFRLEPE